VVIIHQELEGAFTNTRKKGLRESLGKLPQGLAREDFRKSRNPVFVCFFGCWERTKEQGGLGGVPSYPSQRLRERRGNWEREDEGKEEEPPVPRGFGNCLP